MEPTEQPSNRSAQPKLPTHQETLNSENEVERSLQEAEELLMHVRTRYEQIQTAQANNIELERRLSELNAELEMVKTQLATTWENLESQLMTWRDKEELFWQFLRFAGVGFALAMVFNFFVK